MTGILAIVLRGDLDACGRDRIERALASADHCEPGTLVILDLSAASYLDSTIINAICRLRARFELGTSGHRIAIVAPAAHFARRLLEITGLDTIFPVFETLAKARTLASRSAAAPASAD